MKKKLINSLHARENFNISKGEYYIDTNDNLLTLHNLSKDNAKELLLVYVEKSFIIKDSVSFSNVFHINLSMPIEIYAEMFSKIFLKILGCEKLINTKYGTKAMHTKKSSRIAF